MTNINKWMYTYSSTQVNETKSRLEQFWILWWAQYLIDLNTEDTNIGDYYLVIISKQFIYSFIYRDESGDTFIWIEVKKERINVKYFKKPKVFTMQNQCIIRERNIGKSGFVCFTELRRLSTYYNFVNVHEITLYVMSFLNFNSNCVWRALKWRLVRTETRYKNDNLLKNCRTIHIR